MKDGNAAPKAQENNTGGFFAVDRDAWSKVCELGMRQAVAYLVLARGTGGDHRTTSWSTHAIEQRTGIGRDLAKRSIGDLIKAGLIEIEKKGTKPRYGITPAYAVKGCKAYDQDKALHHLFGDKVDPLKNWIWLPNALIDGPASPFVPVELLRRSGRIDLLKTLVDLYAEQTFTTEGGLPWREGGMRQPYHRKQIAKADGRTVWSFRPEKIVIEDGELRDRYGSGFHEQVGALVTMGLLDFVPHLMEHGGLDAEVHHSLANWNQADGSDEAMLAAYLTLTADKLVPAEKLEAARKSGATLAVPLRDFMTGLQVVGIPRLRHRAPTKMLADWRTRNAPIWQSYRDAYSGSLQNLQHQGVDQGPYQGSDQGPVQGEIEAIADELADVC